MTRVNTSLIAANVVAYALVPPSDSAAFRMLALWPFGDFFSPELGSVVGFEPWQLVTSAFLHGSLAHLLLNMVGLASFGSEVERALGPRRYVVLYFAALLAAAVVQVIVVSLGTLDRPYATVGASGAVFGVLLAFGVLFPRRTVLLLLPPVPLPAWLAVSLYGVVELANGVLGTQAGIAHFAHLGGMLGAWLVLRSTRRQGGPWGTRR